MSWIRTTAAYFLSREGDVVEVRTSHIAAVIENPTLFGVTTAEILEAYDRHRERLGSEGKARAEILLSLVKRGWIRLRRYENRYWSITVVWSPEASRSLSRWAIQILGPGISGLREADPYMPVRINGNEMTHGSRDLLTIRKLAEGELLAEKV